MATLRASAEKGALRACGMVNGTYPCRYDDDSASWTLLERDACYPHLVTMVSTVEQR